MNCNVLQVGDRGLTETFRLRFLTQFISHHQGKKKIQQLYITEKMMHWTSVSTHNYLSVTAYIIHSWWKLQSFALTKLKTFTRLLTDACAKQFLSVVEAWGVQHKVTAVWTDIAPNKVDAVRKLPFEHMPCIAHMLQRTITVCRGHSGFGGALAKYCKIVGHFNSASTEELHQQQDLGRCKCYSRLSEAQVSHVDHILVGQTG